MKLLLASTIAVALLAAAPTPASAQPDPGYRAARQDARAWRRAAARYADTLRPGDALPEAYVGKRYAIPNYWDYDLRAPPRGHRWVRYGDDALLVNRKTGLILSIERNVFG